MQELLKLVNNRFSDPRGGWKVVPLLFPPRSDFSPSAETRQSPCTRSPTILIEPPARAT